jgi:protein-S-isoprenylcysteine O-methyltransferase Ste14
MEIMGKPTIHPLLFFSGKIAGYLAFVALPVQLALAWGRAGQSPRPHELAALPTALLGLVLVTISLVNLGKSTRLGLPAGDTEFKTRGLYRFSRNPMYLGFDLLTLSGIVFTAHPAVLALGLYSIFVYHLIIRGEERFLLARFGDRYQAYRSMVRRYL